jgi:ABC-type uncharacterized transport system involved in gliding motility auxiliary subunit
MPRPNTVSSAFNSFLIVGLAAVIAILVNVGVSFAPIRADLTEHAANSLDPISEEAVRSLDHLEVRVYVSPQFPDNFEDENGQPIVLRDVKQAFLDKVSEYQGASEGRMKLAFVKDDLLKAAEDAKLQPFASKEFTLDEGGRAEAKRYVLGASFHYQNVMETLPKALYPGHYEFEITRILERLKAKAEQSLVLKDVLRAGKELKEAVGACVKAIDAAKPLDDSAPDDNPLAMFTGEKEKAAIDAYKTALPKIQAACGGLAAKQSAAESFKGGLKAMATVVAVGQAFKEEYDQVAQALAAPASPEASAGPQPGDAVLQGLAQVKGLGRAMEGEYQQLEDSPGRKRIGIVCAGKAFCPFPSDKPLIPEELKGAILGKNQMAGRVLQPMEQLQQQINMILAQIEAGLFRGRGFEIVRVDLQDAIASDVEGLLLIGPQSKLTDWELYQLDQFVLQGGSLAVLLNDWDVHVRHYERRGQSASTTLTALEKNDSNIGELLGHWGVIPNKDLVMEPKAHDKIIVLETLPAGQFQIQANRRMDYPMVPVLAKFDSENPLVRGVPSLTLPYVSSLTVNPPAGVQGVKLIMSSADAVSTTDDKFDALEPTKQIERVQGQAGEGEKVVAAVVTGELPSFFAGKAMPEKPKQPEPEDDGRPKPPDNDAKPKPERKDKGGGRVLVVGSNLGLEPLSQEVIFEGFDLADFTNNSLLYFDKWQNFALNFHNWRLGLQQIQHTLQDNLQFLFNTLDWAIQQDGLVAIRSKQYTRRPLENISEGQRLGLKVTGVAVAPLLFIALGLGAWVLRRGRRAAIGRRMNPATKTQAPGAAKPAASQAA